MYMYMQLDSGVCDLRSVHHLQCGREKARKVGV